MLRPEGGKRRDEEGEDGEKGGPGPPEDVFSFVFCTYLLYLSVVLLFSGRLGRKEIGRPQ